MVWCKPCDRWFSNERSYNQHVENSSAHRNEESSYDEYSSSNGEPEFECYGCYECFWSEDARENHHTSDHDDRYCTPCKRMFINANNLRQHQHSKVHMGCSIKCPFCPTHYPTASALIIHLESGTCTSGMNRQKINAEIRSLDRNHIITTPQIEYYTSPSSSPNIATESSWNGHFYECFLCSKQSTTLRALNQHLSSSVHEQKMYRCPGPRCGIEFRLLSGLVQHVESESCGAMKFTTVQKGAKNGIEKMVGRMIEN
ncbi:uncharacterized protein EAF02_011933 [Botrytis sinoallii]|uniref:uncharacterized protein n=1 Tax=Botrytis sinoallii TaxID=1463999 RepID=UPI0018FF2D18|nr:uncharacterized protein EAF02_011933 [Botrytis sinoallii]KAF7853628.1 hypothetical protein EAF02_011933 [Botrytis sinoallii]